METYCHCAGNVLFSFTRYVLIVLGIGCFPLLFTGDVFLICVHDGLISIIGHLLSCTGDALLSGTYYICFILCYDGNGLFFFTGEVLLSLVLGWVVFLYWRRSVVLYCRRFYLYLWMCFVSFIGEVL